MKKFLSKTLGIAVLCVLIVTAGFALQTDIANGAGACTTAPGVKCPAGTARTHCKPGESVNGSDGNCHCNTGLKRNAEGLCGDGSAEPGEEDCSAMESTFEEMKGKYEEAKVSLDKAKKKLATASAAYEQVVANNPSSLKPLGTINYEACNDEDKTGCGGEGGVAVNSPGETTPGGACKDISAQCDQLKATVKSTNQSACIIEAQAKLFNTAAGTSTATSTSSTKPNVLSITKIGTGSGTVKSSGGSINCGTACSVSGVASGTVSTLTATPDSGSTFTGWSGDFCSGTSLTCTITINSNVSVTAAFSSTNAPVFSVGLNPSTINQGDTFTISATVSSSSVQTYTVSASKDGVNLGNLIGGVSVGTTARPASVSHSFKTATNIPTGTYAITMTNDANFNQYATANLTVNSYGSASSNPYFAPNNGTVNTNYNTSYNPGYNVGSNLIFLYPYTGVQQKVNSVMPIHWGYNNYISGNIDLYLQTVCANGAPYCTPSTTLIASNVPIQSVYYNWPLPPYIQVGSWGLIVAKQGSVVVGYSPTFIVTQ